MVAVLQGPWKSKQFIKGKPTDTGIKYYAISDPGTGYCFLLLMHNSDDKYTHEKEMGRRFALTWSLVDGTAVENSRSFLDKGHVFYFDRYYTSVPLLYELLNRRTYAVGEYICESQM